MIDRRCLLMVLAMGLAACGAGVTRMPDSMRPPGEAGGVADAVLALPTWAPDDRRIHAPGPGWGPGSDELDRYLAAAQHLAELDGSTISRGYEGALAWAADQGVGLRVQQNLYVLNRMLFVLPETEPMPSHRAFVIEPGMRLPPRQEALVRWPVEVDADQHIVGIAAPMSFLISEYDAIGEFDHFAASHPRRTRGEMVLGKSQD